MNDILAILKSKVRITYANLLDSAISVKVTEMSNLLSGTKNARQILYHLELNLLNIPECQCGNKLAWNDDKRQYRTYCSKKCTATYSQDQIITTNIKKYGVERYTQTVDYLAKTQETQLTKYGYSHHSKRPEFVELVKATSLDRFGVEHVMKLQSTKDQVASTNIKKYGGTYPGASNAVLTKIKNTLMARYGVEHASQYTPFKEKAKQTNLEKYGVDHPNKVKEIVEKSKATRIISHYEPGMYELFTNPEWLKDRNTAGYTIESISEELHISPSHLAKQFHKLNIPIIRHKQTKLEKKLLEASLSENLVVEYGNRKILNGKELDLWYPSMNLAIEINGLYYHGEHHGKHETYHVDKTNQAASLGITLWQFWDYELDDTQFFDKVVNRLKYKNSQCEKIFARNTKIIELSGSDGKEFFDKHHLQCWTPAKHYIALEYESAVVACMSFSPCRFGEKYTWEMIRFSNKSNSQVIGGASKLLAYFIKTYGKPDETLVSYSDRRYSNGDVYSKLGFTHIRNNKPGWFYTNFKGLAGSRYQFQKHLLNDQLANFDPSLTAELNIQNHGYDRIWDCGQGVWVKTFK